MGKRKDFFDAKPEPTTISTHKKHKKHHKKHKKKKFQQHDIPPETIGDTVEIESHQTGDMDEYDVQPSTSMAAQQQQPAIEKIKISNLVNKATTLKEKSGKKKKGKGGKDSGTSSEEERWLDAIESGKLEEVDDELKKIKPKDPKLMTARQRAMYERNTDKEPSPGGEVLMALPSGYKEKVMTAEAIQKAQIKSQKRKQMADEKREKDKKKTMERLLKKQESKTVKQIKNRPVKIQVPMISYRMTLEGATISLPPNVEFPLKPQEPIQAPKPIICGMPNCTNIKRYNCSKTNIPLCSYKCYKQNVDSIKQIIC
uniref:INO80 complex subunit B-like conserved region domain-containing protein n=1 Tax=Corethrella appendiculata TaxID=1370023 RepID=U5EWG8_9DIPT